LPLPLVLAAAAGSDAAGDGGHLAALGDPNKSAAYATNPASAPSAATAAAAGTANFPSQREIPKYQEQLQQH
jgi:hypothetical protein